MNDVADYDVAQVFAIIEEELIESMIRNMKRHKVEEITESKQWVQWQVEQLKALAAYKNHNRKKYRQQFVEINDSIEDAILEARKSGGLAQEIEILKALKQGFAAVQNSSMLQGEFIRTNDRKLDALIDETRKSMQSAETAILRLANDRYRKVIFNAQVYAASGSGTYEKAVDMATKDYLNAGLNCVEYKNGRRVSLETYSKMAVQTACKRAYLTGEGEKRKEWGISTVILNKRGNPCPKCLPFVGKVFIDDVWSGGKASDGPYPLLSSAIARGLYHPNCKDSHTTYFPGISSKPKVPSEKDAKDSVELYNDEQKEKHYRNMSQKMGRLEKYSLDSENKRRYNKRKNIFRRLAHTVDTAREHKPITISDLDKHHKDDILNMISKSDNRVQSITLKYVDDIRFINEKAIGRAVARKDGIRVNLVRDSADKRGAYTATFHEMGHIIDRAAGGLSHKSPAFKMALVNDFDNLVKSYMEMYNVNTDQAYMEIGQNLHEHKYHSISDIVGGITENKCRGTYGHESDYWKRKNALEKESFAHFYEAFARNDVDKINALIEMFPTANKEFMKLMEG